MQFNATPQHPDLDIKCETCKHWLKSEAKRCTPVQGQWIPVRVLLEQGQSVAGMPVRSIAPCTHGPGLWTTVDSEHWCGQYEGSKPY